MAIPSKIVLKGQLLKYSSSAVKFLVNTSEGIEAVESENVHLIRCCVDISLKYFSFMLYCSTSKIMLYFKLHNI